MMTRSTLVFVAAAACIAGVVGGCNSSSKDTKAAAKSDAAAPKQASMGIVNSKCPVMPSHAAGTKATAELNGKQVGFCCPGCLPKWEKMSAAEKEDALKKAM